MYVMSSKNSVLRLLGITIFVFVDVTISASPGEVVWAVNAGGEKHTDTNGIRYQKDTLVDGVTSDYGKNLHAIQRVPPPDMILYQTERYHHSSFSYKIPIKEDGDYVLVLKFCEVWFNAPNQKVFSIQLNDEHDVIDDLDIFAKVGRGTAHDEAIPFKVKNKQLFVNGKKSSITNGKINLTFVKGTADNPKVNAAYVMRGSMSDVPSLPPLDELDVEEEEEEEEEEERASPQQTHDDTPRKSHTSGRKVQDPYAVDDSTSYIVPLVVAIGAFIPLLYCLCKI